jgi:glycerol-3-phosphate acyltransferase PlsX
MEDAPLSVVREKKNSSMGIGLKMLAEGKGDAFVSAGNTGALHAGSTLIVRRIKGIQKSAIATILPYQNPMLLIDSGANIEINPETYVQFAKMGTVYMKQILGVENPRVGLLNIGAERQKGTKTVQDAYGLLEQTEGIHFVGNVEGKELPYGVCDVLVCDGFSGNIVLKLTEGIASYLVSKIKGVFKANPVSMLSGLGVKNGMKKLKKEMDASEYGGAPLLGLSRPVIKAHGSSDAKAFFNAIRQATECVENHVTYEIAKLVVPELIPKENG